MSSTTPKCNFKLLTGLSMAYALLLLCIQIFGAQFMYLPFTHIPSSPAVIMLAVLFAMGDILTEVYGYKQMQQIFISSIVTVGVFLIIITVMTRHPEMNAPSWWTATQSQIAFQQVFHTTLESFGVSAFSLVLSVYLNARIISRWKVLLKGRYFWLRSIGSSGIGMFIFCTIYVSIEADYGFTQDVKLLLSSFVTKIVGLVIFAYPANGIAWLLKKIEKIDVYDYHQSYNPFKNL